MYPVSRFGETAIHREQRKGMSMEAQKHIAEQDFLKEDALDLSAYHQQPQPYGNAAIEEIRLAVPDDHAAIVAMGHSAGMGELTEFDNTLVAVDKKGSLAAMCHVSLDGEHPSINPIIIRERLRGHGIGAALIAEARRRFGDDIELLSRGYAIGFYKFVGCSHEE